MIRLPLLIAAGLVVAPGAGLLSGAALAAQEARDRLLTPVSWLFAHLADPDLVVLQVGSRDEYPAGHIKGARPVSLAAITAPRADGELSVEFPADAVLETQLEALGVGDRSRVVVVAGKDYGPSALRVLSTLYYAGLGDRATLLDGGLPAWKEAGHPLVTDAAPTTRGQLTLRPVQDFRVDADFVGQHAGKPGFVVVDARGQAFFDGVQRSTFAQGDTGRAGHVPGARSLAMTDMWDDQGRIRPTAELRRLFAEAGVKPGDTVVAYCHIGIYANSVLTAARILGHPVRLYDGSFQDWAGRGLPLTTVPGR